MITTPIDTTVKNFVRASASLAAHVSDDLEGSKKLRDLLSAILAMFSSIREAQLANSNKQLT